jgi:hypothetical protein
VWLFDIWRAANHGDRVRIWLGIFSWRFRSPSLRGYYGEFVQRGRQRKIAGRRRHV